MLSITVENDKQHRIYRHEAGPLMLGRAEDRSAEHIVIEDDYVSRRHLRLEFSGRELLQLENLGRNAVELADGTKIAQGERTEISLPSRFRVGRTHIRVDLDDSPSVLDDFEPRDVHVYKTVSPPAPNSPGRNTETLAAVSTSADPERLAIWFETLLSVQRSAAGSSEFYDETVHAIVELVGLDRGLVLLRNRGNWKIEAGHSRREDSDLSFSQSIVAKVLEKRRTFYGNPQLLPSKASLVGIEAVVASPIFEPQGRVVGVLYGSRDIKVGEKGADIQPLEAQVVQLLATSVSAGLNRLDMQRRLRQAEQLAAVGQAIGYILHDLRGPLGNAQQLVQMLRVGDTSTLSEREQLEFIEESVASSLDLLNDSLEFCRGNVPIAPVEGYCSELLATHLKMLRMDLATYEVELDIKIPANLKVELDPDRIARVLRNLVKNAAEAVAGKPDARVEIGARRDDEQLKLWVSDNGPGLPPQVLERLFQPFGTHGKRGGTGFGLAIAKQLVEAHHGTIDVKTGTEGTQISITMPVRFEEETASETPKPKKRPTTVRGKLLEFANREILVADDGKVNQRLIKGLLEKVGCVVTTADTGKAAIDLQQNQSFDLIFMDVEMPDTDGLEATAVIRERERETQTRTPIVALTAHDDEETQAACQQVDMDGVLVKPVTPREVYGQLRRHCH